MGRQALEAVCSSSMLSGHLTGSEGAAEQQQSGHGRLDRVGQFKFGYHVPPFNSVHHLQ